MQTWKRQAIDWTAAAGWALAVVMAVMASKGCDDYSLYDPCEVVVGGCR